MSLEGRTFLGRVGLQQRVLPEYRLPFISLLGEACLGGLEVFAGQPQEDEAIVSGGQPEGAKWVPARNQHWLAGPFYLLRQPALLDWLMSWQPAVLILEANIRYLDSWRALKWARRQRVPVIGWGLGAPALADGFHPFAWLWRLFLRRFDGLIAYSSKGAAEYRSAGLTADRVFVALNAAVDGPVEVPARQAADSRPLRLLFVGRLQRRKEVDRLLEACGSLGPGQVELRIVGDGPDRQRLEALARRHLPPAEFLGDQRGQALAECYAWADLFVLPGTGGLAIQQAMAHGLPVIVGQGDGTQADLVRPVNGWLLEDDTVAALRSTLQEAMARSEELPAMGKASAALVREQINPAAMTQTFMEAIHAVAEGAD